MLKIIDFEKKYQSELYKIHLQVMPKNDIMSLNCFNDEFEQTTRKYFVAVKNNIPIGYIGLFNTIDDCNIIGIAVLQDKQRQGIGSLLLNKAKEYARENNIKTLSIEVDTKNDKAINFYKKVGFLVTNIRKNYYKNNSDAYIMFLYL